MRKASSRTPQASGRPTIILQPEHCYIWIMGMDPAIGMVVDHADGSRNVRKKMCLAISTASRVSSNFKRPKE
jgi:hypothetical protein